MYRTLEVTVELHVGTGRRTLRTEGGKITNGYNWAAAIYPKVSCLVNEGELIIEKVQAVVEDAVRQQMPSLEDSAKIKILPAGRFSDGFLVGISVD